MLKINNPLTGRRYFADERQADLAVPANWLGLIQIGFLGKGKLDHISRGKPHGRVRTWRIWQRWPLSLAAAARERGKNQETEKIQKAAQLTSPMSCISTR
jgi:hypothetical protein